MKAIVRAPGTCGELIQGVINGEDLLVSCPVNLYSTVSVTKTANGTVTVYPEDREKALMAAKKTLQLLGVLSNMGLSIEIKSELPLGKGWGSSTADIAATCQAVALVYGRILEETEIAKIATAIEPTDSSVFSKITAFNHIKGDGIDKLGVNPRLKVVSLDFPGLVDTLEFNNWKELRNLNKTKESKIIKSLKLLIKGLRKKDSILIGRAASISAQAHQSIIYKDYLDELVEIGEKNGAVGVTIAHSGTVAGLLFPPRALRTLDVTSTLQNAFPHVESINELNMVPGGTEIIKITKTAEGVES